MGLIGRYVFRQTFSAMVLILLSLSGVVWIALALRQLKLVTSKGQDTLTLIQMTTLALPGLMALIALRRLLDQLIHRVAVQVFASELRAFLSPLPLDLRNRLRDLIHKSVPPDRPEMKVLLLRNLKKQLPEQNNYRNRDP